MNIRKSFLAFVGMIAIACLFVLVNPRVAQAASVMYDTIVKGIITLDVGGIFDTGSGTFKIGGTALTATAAQLNAATASDTTLQTATNALQVQATALQTATNALQVQATALQTATNTLQVQATAASAATNVFQAWKATGITTNFQFLRGHDVTGELWIASGVVTQSVTL